MNSLRKKLLDQFEHDGYLVIRNVLSRDKIENLKQVIDRIHENDVCRRPERRQSRWDLRNCILEDKCFTEVLLDPTLLAIPLTILGWNIKLLTSHIVRTEHQFDSKKSPIEFHQDGGSISFELQEPLPALIVKMGYCISGDITSDSGVLRVVPGSHRLVGPPVMNDRKEPYGAVDAYTGVGDLILFDWRCWHAVSPNNSVVTRRTLYYGFGPRWMMPMDYDSTVDRMTVKDPVLIQLLGGSSSSLGHYLPKNDDVPLKKVFESYKG